MHGITPPRLGSVRDKVLTEMFARERVLEHESLQTMAVIIAMSLGIGEEKAQAMFKILDKHRESKLFKHWSIDTKRAAVNQRGDDVERLQKLNKLKGSK